jgi:hypothetical protein
VDQVEAVRPAEKTDNRLLMLTIAALKVIGLSAGLTRGQKFTTDARSRGRCYNRVHTPARHFALQRPEHLLSASG